MMIKKTISLLISFILLVSLFPGSFAEGLAGEGDKGLKITESANETIDGDLKAESDNGDAVALDIDLNKDAEVTVDVKQDVEATSSAGDATAVHVTDDVDSKSTIEVDVTVGQNVTAETTEADATATGADLSLNQEGSISLEIAGDMNVESKEGEAIGIIADNGIGAGEDSKENSEIVVTLEGNLAVEGLEDKTTGVVADNAIVEIGGNLTSSGDGIEAVNGATVSVGGDVTTEANGVTALFNSDIDVGGKIESDDIAVDAKFGSTVSVGLSEENKEPTVDSLDDLRKLETGETAVSAGKEAVIAKDESSVLIAGNTEVNGTGDATGIELHNNGEKENEVLIAGNLTVEGYDATGIISTVDNDTNFVAISENLTVTGEDTAVGVKTEYDETGETQVIIGGDVTVSGKQATAVDAESARVIVLGKVSSTDKGISAYDSEIVVGVSEETMNAFPVIESFEDFEALQSEKTAVEAVTEGIHLKGGTTALTGGDVEVKNPDGDATGINIIDIYSADEAERVTFAGVAGDLSVSAGGDAKEATGVSAVTVDSDTVVLLTGDLSVDLQKKEGEDGSASGIYLDTLGDTKSGTTTVLIGGEIDVNAAVNGEDKDYVDATGIISKTENASNVVQIAGPITVTVVDNGASEAHASGVSAEVIDGSFVLNAENDIMVEVIDAGENSQSSGLELYVEKGNFEATIGGNIISAGGDDPKSAGIYVSGVTDGTATVTVGKDVASDNVGALITNVGEEAIVNLIVEGELSGDNAALLIDDTVTTENLNLTVYKVALTEVDGEAHAVLALNEKQEVTVSEASRAVEEEISYIIKVEANENGDVTADKETAKEGETVTMRITANAGYHVVAAYNGEGQEVPLLKDANGNYYVEVPRGGGIYLSARIDQDYELSGDDDDDERKPAKEKKQEPLVVDSSIPVQTPVESSTTLPKATADQVSGKAAVKVLLPSAVELEDAEKEVIAALTADEQAALILKQAGFAGVTEVLGLPATSRVEEALKVLTTDLSSGVITAVLRVNGVKGEWKIISVVKNSVIIRYAFRQKADGTWEFIILTDEMIRSFR